MSAVPILRCKKPVSAPRGLTFLLLHGRKTRPSTACHRAGTANARTEPCPGVKRPVLVEKPCTLLATPLSWLLALDRWLCVPAFRRVCPDRNARAHDGGPIDFSTIKR